MEFNTQRHVRAAGWVASIIGFATNNWYVILFGWWVVIFGYAWTVDKIEKYIELQPEPKEDTDAIR